MKPLWLLIFSLLLVVLNIACYLLFSRPSWNHALHEKEMLNIRLTNAQFELRHAKEELRSLQFSLALNQTTVPSDLQGHQPTLEYSAKFGGAPGDLPVKIPLPNGLERGSRIELVAAFRENFEVSLKNYLQYQVAVLQVIMEEHLVVVKSVRDGLETEEDVRVFPFKVGKVFTLELLLHDDGTNVTTLLVNGDPIANYSCIRRPELLSRFTVRCFSEKQSCLKVASVRVTSVPATNDRRREVLTQLIQGQPRGEMPPADRDHHYKLFTAIVTSVENIDRRNMIRGTWLNSEELGSKAVGAQFYVGLPSEPLTAELLRLEMEKFGDIVALDTHESYYFDLTNKTAAVVEHATDNFAFDFFLKCDDDVFVRFPHLLFTISQYPQEGLYLGQMIHNVRVNRSPYHKWGQTREENPESKFPDYANGPGYVLSRNLAEYVSGERKRGGLPILRFEDVSMGIWLRRWAWSGGKLWKGASMDIGTDCRETSIVAHHIPPWKMQRMWYNLLFQNGFCTDSPKEAVREILDG